MQDIMEELMLLMNLTNIKIKETINIKDVDNLILSIEKNKPSGVKGKYFKSFNICTTMSPSIKLELNQLKIK